MVECPTLQCVWGTGRSGRRGFCGAAAEEEEEGETRGGMGGARWVGGGVGGGCEERVKTQTRTKWKSNESEQAGRSDDSVVKSSVTEGLKYYMGVTLLRGAEVEGWGKAK